LQLRNPAVLPSLHQLPHKTTKPDGAVSDFADNLKKIKGFGNKNKSTEAELLFQFFRFYAHEFDYDKHVLSVRQGKLITKQEKKWHYAMNNQLCVEEPFNTSRNLGNTADEYSFRGLHLELRRAFDLISAAKLEEACEQYVYPKEEERVWSRPASQPRPALLRSSSQTNPSGRGGRGGHRGGRHSNNYHRTGGSNNRRSSATTPTYDPNMFVQPVNVNMQQDMSWFAAAAAAAAGNQYPFPFAQQDLMQMAYQESMRQQLHHLYAQQQSPAFMTHQGMGQQRMSPNTGSSGQQSATDRSRTNSFDTAPIGATLRPDLYALYGMGINQQFYAQTATGYGTYPSSPVTSNGMGQEFRRPLQRSTVTSDNGISASSSSLRSQSQPASRSPSTTHSRTAYTPGAGPSSVPGYAPRHMNGVTIPSFISDDADHDSKASSDSPQSEESRSNNGLLGARGSSPSQQTLSQSHSPTTNGIAFGDVVNQSSSPRRRRLSTDQLPQTILDRRMRRTSRSPSPLDHSRAFATGTIPSSPLGPAPFPGVGGQAQNKNLATRPLIVNGSGLKTSMTAASNQGQKDSLAPEECAMAKIDNALHINTAASANGTNAVDAPPSSQPSLAPAPSLPAVVADRPPVIVNGSNSKLAIPSTEDASFRDRIAMMNSYQTNSYGMPQDVLQANGMTRLPSSTKQRLMSRQTQNGVIAPLDLAIADHRKGMVAEIAHLSPVYETQTSSPTALRKPDVSTAVTGKAAHEKADAKATREETTKPVIKSEEKLQPAREGQKSSKTQKPTAQNQRNNTPRENGHVRGAKSESDGGWQKAGKGKKKGSSGLAQATHAEQLPKSDSERKGG
jgi:hypothetical protein